MSDAPSTPAAALSQRKLVAVFGAAALLVCFTLAFMLGGKKAPAAKDMEKDLQIGMLDASSIDLSAQATPDNWVENTVANAEVGEAAVAAVPSSAQDSSSLVNGDGAGTGTQTRPQPVTVSTASNSSAANPPVMPVEAEPHAVAVYGPGAPTPSKPAGATPAGTAQVAQAAPKSRSTDGGDKAGTKATSPAGTAAKAQAQTSSSTAPQAIPVQVAKVVAPSSSSSSSKAAAAGSGRKNADPKPVFVRPAQKRPGVVAQTRSLITKKQYSPPAAPKAAKPAHEEKDADSAPARVRQQEARSYAQQATQQLQQKKVLPPTQHVRLPRRAETTNPAVWHEDDTPASADERRPFGLVVAEEKPGFTPEGIPVRTDVPAGTSPLRQNGPDKPLWKRPE